MVSLKSRSYITVLLHFLLWGLFAFILLFYHPLSWNIRLPLQFWIKQGLVLVILMVVFYLNSYVLVPRLLLRNKNILFIVIVLAIALLAGPLVKALENILHLPLLMEQAVRKVGIPRLPKRDDGVDLFLVMMILLIVGISTSLTLIQKWQADKQLRELLEKEKISSELSFLKAQINPHFFFNTLNNIYALSHVDVEASRKALHKLSRMMRYLLYETQQGITPLSKELSFISDYIELMRLRLTDTVKISFEKPVLNEELMVAPMLFLPYIENAFKHGISTLSPSEIRIAIKMNGQRLEMTVENSIFKEQGALADPYGGIGLANTKRRLDLLYPEKYTFSAAKSEPGNVFIVHLTLILDGTEMYSS
ncbi:sensor histidine kinase [Pedobacter gandavensis]|uniref:sensor histidine kinase n=1 Tax=Pedobacter gandavensis TaxID=2679963 RepID=UPI00292E6B33|nr:histidine kinase [Pedobacter gandavensis]